MENLLENYQMILNIDYDHDKDSIESIELSEIKMFDDDYNIIENKPFINTRLNEINYNKTKIGLYDRETNVYKKYKDNNCFSDKKLFEIILDFEKTSRPLTDFCGHLDYSHIYFEGLSNIKLKGDDEKDIENYYINWGS